MSADTDARIEARLKALDELVAKEAIRDCLSRYMRGQDRLDPELHLSAFHDDAWVDCGLMSGSGSQFVAFAQSLLGEMEASQHLIGQSQISVTGDGASGEVYFLAWHRIRDAGEARDLFVAGRYIDEYRCRDGDWRIWRRREIIDWARTDPAADGFLAGNPGLPQGARSGLDFSQMRNWDQLMAEARSRPSEG